MGYQEYPHWSICYIYSPFLCEDPQHFTRSSIIPVTLYNFQRQVLKHIYLNMDGTVEYFGKEHLPYGALAVVMALLFNVLHVILLCLFPCRCFHRSLNHFQIQRESLREFVIVFHGEFKDQPRDYQYFAVFYLLLRTINLLFSFSANGIMYFQLSAGLFALTSVTIAVFKPYKKSLHNYTDTVLISLTGILFLGIPAKILMFTIGEIQNYHVYKYIWMLALLIHPLYGIGMLIYIFLPVQKVYKGTCFSSVCLYA